MCGQDWGINHMKVSACSVKQVSPGDDVLTLSGHSTEKSLCGTKIAWKNSDFAEMLIFHPFQQERS